MTPRTRALATIASAAALAAGVAGIAVAVDRTQPTPPPGNGAQAAHHAKGVGEHGRHFSIASTRLSDATGSPIGGVLVVTREGVSKVILRVDRIPTGFAASAWHGIHIHANDNPANGSGCVADPAQPSNTWFVSADGHLGSAGGQVHGGHMGDLPSVYIGRNGTGTVSFVTDALMAEDLAGTAIILHAGRDNYGNVPVGTAPDQYTANSPDAVSKTNSTGNAGDRFACGVVEMRSGY